MVAAIEWLRVMPGARSKARLADGVTGDHGPTRPDTVRIVPWKRADDVLVAASLVACAVLCMAFRRLPMVDLPQHYAMVSILLHKADPSWGFAQRYTTDFLHRPYATVYWLGEALGSVMPLGAAMRVVVAVCTVAPFAGAHALLAATGRPRVWLLPAIPFAFGSLWHWGFLNFLLGTGLFLAGLALVVVVSARPSTRGIAALGATSVVLFFTHFHGLLMLLLFAPAFAWAWKKDEPGIRPYVRALGPLVPAAVAAAAFVLVTWADAQGSWARMDPATSMRISRFPEFLAGGLPGRWPLVWFLAFAVVSAGGLFAGTEGARPRKTLAALAFTWLAQIAMYFLLPLNTPTATFVSARHALLVALLLLPLLPVVEGAGARLLRGAAAAIALLGLVVNASFLASFEREAADFDGVLAAMEPARRVVPLVFARSSAFTGPSVFPYLHFAAYYQAQKGGELARSFAVVWNVPVRYRADYARYPIAEDVEWAPGKISPEDLRHFDYALLRGGPPAVPPQMGLSLVARSGAWRLYENPGALPAVLPAP